jgi:hypothetical protein
MSRVPNPLAGLVLVGLLGLTAGAWADSLASSASSAGSASVGSLSDSVHGSSNSSSRETTAAGDYRVVEVAELAERPGMLRLTLQPVARTDEAGVLWLDLPQGTWQAQHLVTGDLLTAVARPYGLEIARTDTRQAIYLLLADDWRHDLDARPLAL